MKIVMHIPGAVPRVLPNGNTVLSPFRAIVELDLPKVSVEMEIEVDPMGSSKCVALGPIRSLDGRAANGVLAREIPDALLRQQAASVAASILGYEGSSDGERRFAFQTTEQQVAAYRRSASKSRRGNRPPPNQVVDVIRYARASGETPANLICDLWDVSLPTAHRWVREVRVLL
jgi:hypothetical protein